MKIVHRGRRMGKTTEIIKLANEAGAYIVVASREDAKRMMEYNPPPDRFPVTMAELMSNRMNGSFVRKVAFDDLDRCMHELLSGGMEVVAASITGEKDEGQE